MDGEGDYINNKKILWKESVFYSALASQEVTGAGAVPKHTKIKGASTCASWPLAQAIPEESNSCPSL